MNILGLISQLIGIKTLRLTDSTPAKQKSKSAAKTPSRRPKVAIDKSIIPPSELAGRSPVAPGTSKKSTAGSSMSRKKPKVGSPEGSAVDPPIAVKEVAPLLFRRNLLLHRSKS